MNKFFDHIFCVNLDRRPERWEQCVEEFSKWGLDVERFSAVDGNLHWKPTHKVPAGSIGNCMSKIGIIRLAKERGYKNFLLLEDDVEFAEDFNVKFSEWSKEIPENWDMLWIGGNHNLWRPEDFDKIEMYSPHLLRCRNTYSTHAFALRESVFDLVLERLLPLEPQDDIILAEIQKETLALGFRPNLAFQRSGFSDVLLTDTNYDFLKKI